MKKFSFIIFTIVFMLCTSLALAGVTPNKMSTQQNNATTLIDKAQVLKVDESSEVKAIHNSPSIQAIDDNTAVTASNPKAEITVKKNRTFETAPADPNVILQGGDDIASATVIPSIPYSNTGTNVGYTNNYEVVCPYASTSPDVVYSYAPAANGGMNVEICGSDYDTKIFVFENDETTVVGCSDDACGSDGYKSQISGIPLTAGNTYYIVVDGYGGDAGNYILNITETGDAPANDLCANAQAITGPYPVQVSGTNIDATVDCPGLLNWNAVWYSIELPYASNDLTIDFCPTLTDIGSVSVGIVYYFACDDCPNYQLMSYSFPTCGSGLVNPILTELGIAGPTTIYFPAYFSVGQDFIMDVNVTEGATPPPNDLCENVTPVELFEGIPLTFNGTVDGATSTGDCASFSSYGNAWEAFTISECMNITLDYCGSSTVFGNSWLGLAIDCPCTGTIGGATYDFTTCTDGNVTIRWTGVPAGTYYYPVMLDPANGSVGEYTINVSGVACPPPSPNDNCADFIDIGNVTDLAFNTLGTTFDGPGACLTSPNIWYRYTATCTGVGNVDLFGSTFDTKLAVYEGGECPTAPPPPTPVDYQGGDNIASAAVITDPLPVAYNGTTAGYNHDYTINCGYDGGAPDVVYSYTPAVDEVINVNLCTTSPSWDTRIAVYEDTEGNEIGCNDDFCGVLSGLEGLNFLAGHTYYIIVAGYNTNFGPYTMTMISANTSYVLLGCNDDSGGPQSSLTFPTVAGNQYMIEVGGYSSLAGEGDITTSCGLPPANDDCASVTPEPLGIGAPLQFVGDNANSTNDCALLGTYAEVWHAFTTTECMDVTVDYCGTDPVFSNVYIALVEGCPCGSYILYSVFDFTTCPDGNGTILYRNLPAGTYYIPVLANPGQAWGPYVINVNGVACPPPPEDLCVDPEYSNGVPGAAPNAYAAQCDPYYPFSGGCADDFILTADADIAAIAAYCGFWNGPTGTSPASFEGINITFYLDNAGTPGGQPIENDPACGHEDIIPGGVVSTELIDPADYTFDLLPNGYYQLNIPITPVHLTSGVTYWVEFEPLLDFSTNGQVGWQNTDSFTGNSAMQVFPLAGIPTWTAAGFDMAFCLKTAGGGGCVYVPGDINGNGAANGIDVTYGVNYFKGAAVPPIVCSSCPQTQPFYAAGDVNASCTFNGIDITYFVSFLKGGPALRFCVDCPPSTVAKAPTKAVENSNNQ